MDSDSAFQTLKSEITAALRQIRAEGSQVFLKGNYDDAKKLADRAEQLEGFLKNIHQMQREWKGLMTQPALPGMTAPRGRKSARIQPRAKTHARYFRLPILQALVELGGSADTARVVDRVGELLADQLNEYDREKLASGHEVRWRNTAGWVRNTLKNEGLISGKSVKGTWEITEAGVEYLKIQGE